MARKRLRRYYPRFRRFRRRPSMTIPIAPVAGLLAGLTEPAKRAMYGDFDGAVDELCHAYLGYSYRSKTWVGIDSMKRGLLPLVIGFAVHWVAGRLGVNRLLARAKVPLIRI